MEQKKTVWCNIFLIDQERIEKVEHFYRKLRYSQMHSNPGATLKIPDNTNDVPLGKKNKGMHFAPTHPGFFMKNSKN